MTSERFFFFQGTTVYPFLPSFILSSLLIFTFFIKVQFLYDGKYILSRQLTGHMHIYTSVITTDIKKENISSTLVGSCDPPNQYSPNAIIS